MGEVQAQRQVAIKCNAASLLKGRYVKEEGWNPNYIESSLGRISRAHLVGVVVQQVSDQEFLMDDGTGKLIVRAFNMDNAVPPVGQLIRLIGRPREYQDMRYVLPEIIKHIDNVAWAKLHQLEVSKVQPVEVPAHNMSVSDAAMVKPVESEAIAEPVTQPEVIPVVQAPVVPAEVPTVEPEVKPVAQAPQVPEHAQPEQPATQEVSTPEPVEQNNKPGGQDAHTIIYALIKSLDEGNGADYEEVLEKAKLDKGETVVESLLKEGEIFLIAPGKLKVLE